MGNITLNLGTVWSKTLAIVDWKAIGAKYFWWCTYNTTTWEVDVDD